MSVFALEMLSRLSKAVVLTTNYASVWAKMKRMRHNICYTGVPGIIFL